MALTAPLTALTLAVSNGAVHYAIDTRRWAEPKDGLESYPVIVDQIMHLTTITILGVALYGI